MGKLHKPFPVQEAQIDEGLKRRGKYTIDGGTLKHIFLDRNAGAEGEPCWLIYVPALELVYRAREWNAVELGPLGVRGRGHRDHPLKPDGPAFWVETIAAVEVIL